MVFSEGKFISFREIDDSRFELYQLYNFFVEIDYNKSQNRIVSKLVFQNQNDCLRLDIYAGGIKLQKLSTC